MKYSPNAATLILHFGGVRAMSRETLIPEATISRWASDGSPRMKLHKAAKSDPRYRKDARAGHGHIPSRYNDTIMLAASRLGFPARARVCLEWNCPTCGQRLGGVDGVLTKSAD